MSSKTLSLKFKNDIDAIKFIIDLNYDASEFYRLAQTKTDNKEHIDHFDKLDFVHRSVVKILQERMMLLGAEVKDTQVEKTLKGQAQQFFTQFLTQFTSDTDEMFIRKLEDTEDRCLAAFEDAIYNTDITATTRQVLLKELDTVISAHDSIKILKNSVVFA